MDGLYVFNNPWSVQSMEKHTTYCAMMHLGMPIPETWLIPPKSYEPLPDLQPTLRALREAVRPRRGRRAARLPAVHEAVRRRRLEGGQPDRRRGRAARALRGERQAGDAPAEGGAPVRLVRALHRPRAADPPGQVRPGRAAARPLHAWPRTSCPTTRPASCATPRSRSTRSSAGTSTRARRCARTAPGTRSTSRTRAPTRRSPRCTTTSRGWSRPTSGGRCSTR